MKRPEPPARRPRGRTRTAAAVAVIVVGAGVAACLDFADPVEPEPGPGQLQASVTLLDGGSPRMELNAAFDPGVDTEGNVRSSTEPSLRILGMAVEPSDRAGPERGPFQYRSTDTLDVADLERAALEMVGPRLSTAHPRAVLSVPLIWRAGRDSVERDDGEDLELPLRGAPGGTEGEDLRLQWRLEVVEPEGAGTLFTAMGRTAIPDTLEIPRAVLVAGESGEPLHAELQVQITTRSSPGETGYESFLVVTTRLEWRIFGPPR